MHHGSTFDMVTYDIQHIHRTTPYTKEAKSAPAVASTAQSSADDFNMELEMAGVDELIGVLMANIYIYVEFTLTVQ